MSLIALLGAVITIVATLGAAFIVWRSTSAKTVADLWKAEAEAQKTKADRLEKTLSELTLRVAALEKENEILKAVRDHSSQIRALHDEMTRSFVDLATLVVERGSNV